MSLRDDDNNLPTRGKLALSILSLTFTLSIVTFIVFEDLSLLDSIYFLVVTVSTVGFGDLTPSHPFTKIVLIILIISGLTTLAVLSEITLDKVIKLRMSPSLELPSVPLDYTNHIVIAGFNFVVENIALHATDRFFDVVIIDQGESNVRHARSLGYEAYLADIEIPITMELLNINQATALYLFLENDNLTIQSAIITKQCSPDLLIYANTINHLSIEFGEMIGITRTYHQERLLASFIDVTSRQYRKILFPNQNVLNSRMRLVLASREEPIQKEYQHAIPIGYIDQSLSRLIKLSSSKEIENVGKNKFILYVMPVHLSEEKFESLTDEVPIKYRKVFFGGWSSFLEHVIEHVNFDKSIISVITFSKDDIKSIQEIGLNAIYTARENVTELINNQMTSEDLVINIFESLPDSLLLDILIDRSQIDPAVLQIAKQMKEISMFLRLGVDRVIALDLLTSRSMLQILLTSLELPVSTIYMGSHIFEHKVNQDDPFCGKSILEIESMDFQILILLKHDSDELLYLPQDTIIEKNDNILLFKQHQIFTQDRISNKIHSH